MFGLSSFSETSLTDDSSVRSEPCGGCQVVIYFNKDVITFPLAINKQTDFSLKINKQADFSLDINKILEFSVRR